ncbi:DNA-directed RNA polymerase subunit alpha C-terminal domain-containing protein [Nonomuraea sp. NPDC050663]|uniref:DNA-directed RNA polymerase subunit alpha C-terminal domain-containing protein n=1 Tax=Nonomuraea sp. NPDC050663 TaxID=3364370 RepID=UPI0037B5F84B
MDATGKQTVAELVKATGLPLSLHVNDVLDAIEGGNGTRARNCLARNDITTLEHLQRADDEGLLDIRNFGELCLKEVKQVLARRAESTPNR